VERCARMEAWIAAAQRKGGVSLLLCCYSSFTESAVSNPYFLIFASSYLLAHCQEQDRMFPQAERDKLAWLEKRKEELAFMAPFQREHQLRREAKELGYTFANYD
jgi:hypothetical protein